MKKIIPILLAGLSLILFGVLIAKNEQHLAKGQSIYVSLAPVDPRALLQGDYMALRYDLNFVGALAKAPIGALPLAYVALDAQGRVLKSSFKPESLVGLGRVHPLQLKMGRAEQPFPASDSYFFAEGLASCYEQARFALFKVSAQGKPMLADLVDEQLQTLNCGAQQKWQNGAQKDARDEP